MPRLLTRARDAILQRRYAPRPHKPVRAACLWREGSGWMRMLTGHASQSKSLGGLLYRRRVRLVRRFGLSAFLRRD